MGVCGRERETGESLGLRGGAGLTFGDGAALRGSLAMVKEGHDSTVRPKLQTYEFDNGKMYLDTWAADGKPALSRTFVGRLRALKIFAAVTLPAAFLLLGDWGDNEHIFSPVQRAAFGWWSRFVEMDEMDVAKARSVAVGGPPAPPRGVREA